MANVRFDITMSLDGFVAHPNDDPGRLHDWLFTGDTVSSFDPSFRTSGASTEVLDEMVGSAGAFVVGRRMFDAADAWGGRSPWPGIETFVVTHHPPDGFSGTGFTFVTGVERAIELAKETAVDSVVSIGGGPNIAIQAIRAGLVDEIQLHLAPLTLGVGVRLFDDPLPDWVRLEQTRVIEAPGVTHILYRLAGRGA